MQSIIAISVAFLAAVVSAAPALPTTSVQFTNDASGRSANVAIPLTGTQSVKTLLDNSPFDVNDTFFATSFFLQANFQGVKCDLTLPSTVVTISEQHTFAGFAPASAPLDLVNAQITCAAI